MGTERSEAGGPSELPRAGGLPSLAVLSLPVRYAVLGLFTLALAYTLYFASSLLLPIVFALFLALLLSPLVAALSRIGLPDWIGAIIVVVGLLAAIAVGVQQLSQPASVWVDRAPVLLRQVEYRLWPVRRTIEEARETSEKIQGLADGAEKDPVPVVVDRPSLAERVVDWTAETVAQVGMTLALLFFLLADGRRTARRYLRGVAASERRHRIHDLMQLVQQRAAAYLGTVALIQTGVGLLTAAALYAFGVPNAVLWGAMATLLGFMPYIGPVVTTGVIAVVSLTTFEDWLLVIGPPLTYAVITTIEGYLVTPAVLGRRMTLNPIAIFLSMLFWTWVWGIPGALLSVPILVTGAIVFKELKAMNEEAAAAAQAEAAEEGRSGVLDAAE